MFKKNKIIFAETNASVGNGHHVSNIENIPAVMRKENIPFEMVTETNVKGKHFIPFFTPIKDIEDTGTDEGIDLRRSDYQRFVKKFTKNICFILSNYSKDLYAWLDVLSDKKYQEIIKKNNSLLIIHAVVLYPLFFERKKIIKQILRDLKGYVFFSFFTSEIADIAKTMYGRSGFLGMIHPVYDKVYDSLSQKKFSKRYDFTFWLGGGENWECHVAEFLKKAKRIRRNFKCSVRISPVRDYNYLLLNKLKEYSDIELYTEGMSNNACIELFSKSKIGVMPYDDFEGSVKASAVFENFILCGVPVLVPKKTWMHEILKTLGNPGLGFKAGDISDFNEKLLYIEKNYGVFAEKTRQAADRLYKRLSIDSFLQTIYALDAKRTDTGINFYGNAINKARVSEGSSYFRSLYFDSLKQPESYANTQSVIKKEMNKYSRLRFSLIKHNIYDRRSLNYFFTNLNKYNPSAVSKVIATLSSDILKDKDYRKVLIQFVDQNYFYFPVSALNRVADYGLLSSKVTKELRAVDYFSNISISMNVLLADFLASLGLDKKALGLRKALFSKMEKIKRKTILENYTLASLCLKMELFDKAKRIYIKILKSERSEANLKGGCCFHLGCLWLRENNKEKALSYFSETLDFIPQHSKAKEHIELLNQG